MNQEHTTSAPRPYAKRTKTVPRAHQVWGVPYVGVRSVSGTVRCALTFSNSSQRCNLQDRRTTDGVHQIHKAENFVLSSQRAALHGYPKELQKEDISASVVGIWKLIQWYKQFGTTVWHPGSGRASIVSARVEATIEAQTNDDDETTASQLQTMLTRRGCSLSLATIKRSCSRMGWTFRGSAYCQLIRESNKEN